MDENNVLMDDLRLLIDPPASGAWNMAVDEALVETAAEQRVATLRFYAWEVPTLSLGYFQAAAEREQHPASRDCPLVRRASGGGAILHDRELTYSIALPYDLRRPLPAARLYDLFHETLVRVLATFGVTASLYRPPTGECRVDSAPAALPEPFLCFQRRSCGDIVSGADFRGTGFSGTGIRGEAKIVGSAQRRRRGAVLQHGSILLARSSFAPELSGIYELSTVSIAPADLITRWLPELAAHLTVEPVAGKLTGKEHEQARRFAAQRFTAAEYLHRR